VQNSPVTSLAYAVVGDFDDNNSFDDIVWRSGNQWLFSSSGRGVARVIASTTTTSRYADIENALWGDFDRDGHMDALRFERTYTMPNGETSPGLILGQRFMRLFTTRGADGWPVMSQSMSMLQYR
jgi:hypothetical protein